MGFKEHNFNYSGVKFPVFIDESESIISNTIDQTGVWEGNQLSLYHQLVHKNEVFLDIGANVGVNSLFMSKIVPGARVISIEASPANFKILKKNIEGSGIEAYCIAVANVDGFIKFSGSGTNAKIDGSYEDSKSISVPAKKLDTFLEELSIREIGLLKIDVEGYTDFVLSGAEKTLPITKQIIVEFSILDVQSRFKYDISNVTLHFKELLDLLSFHYSHFYYISRQDGLVRIANAVDLVDLLAMEHMVGDILATKEEVLEAIAPTNLLGRRVAQLLPENHHRIIEIQNLGSRIAELEQKINNVAGLRQEIDQLHQSWTSQSRTAWDFVAKWLGKKSRFI